MKYVDIIIIGTGMSGLYSAYQIKQFSPDTSFLILEKYKKNWIGGRTMTKEYEFQYDENGNACALTIVGENISIPLDPANSDYQQYLKLVEQNNV